MATCPACKGTRIRDDYKPAPLVLRFVGVRALLCDYCNHQFRAFSPLPPKSRKPRSLERKADIFNEAPGVDLNQLDLASTGERAEEVARSASQAPTPKRKPALSSEATTAPAPEPLQSLAQAAAPRVTPDVAAGRERLEISVARRDLKTEITKLHAGNEPRTAPQNAAEAPESSASGVVPRFTPACPECGSTEIRRRHRTSLERAALSLTQHKAYSCRACKASFYAKPDESAASSNLAGA